MGNIKIITPIRSKKTITIITCSNTNNSNKTRVCTLATRSEISVVLLKNGWAEEDQGLFMKDRVIVTLEENTTLVEDAKGAIVELLCN